MVVWWERLSYLLVISVAALLCVLYTNKAVEKSQQVSCPIYSILDRPVDTAPNPESAEIRQAIHEVRIAYNCAPPLIGKK